MILIDSGIKVAFVCQEINSTPESRGDRCERKSERQAKNPYETSVENEASLNYLTSFSWIPCCCRAAATVKSERPVPSSSFESC